MTESRIRCTGQGKKHSYHIYHPDVEQWLLVERWTKDAGCRPYITEQRDVGPWIQVGQQQVEAAS